MAVTRFAGTLRRNEIFNVQFNMVIGQKVHDKNLGGGKYNLVDRHRKEGTLFGDTYLYISTDALFVENFEPDTVNQLNLLAIQRAPDPFTQSIVLTEGRFIQVTTDEYWSKRMFNQPNVFDTYKNTTLKWTNDTKKIYDMTLFNTFVGNVTESNSAVTNQEQTIELNGITAPSSNTMNDEAYRRLVAETIAQRLDDIFTDMADVSRKWNDLEFTRSWDPNDFDIIWNADAVNYLRNTGLPSLYHNDGLLKIKEENILPRHYFGDGNAVSSGVTIDSSNYGTICFKDRVKLGKWTAGVTDEDVKNNKDVFWAGQACPIGYVTTGTNEYSVTKDFETAITSQNECVICKIIHKDDIPYMSGYQTQREFVNDKNLSKNHYLHFMHNPLTHIYEYPLITVKVIRSSK